MNRKESRTFLRSAVLSNDPERASEDFAGFDVAERLEELLSDGASKVGETLDHLPVAVKSERSTGSRKEAKCGLKRNITTDESALALHYSD